MTTKPTTDQVFTYEDDFRAYLDAVKRGELVEVDRDMFRYWLGVLPPILDGGDVTMPDGRRQQIDFAFAEGAEELTAFWVEEDEPTDGAIFAALASPNGDGRAYRRTRYFAQRTDIINQYARTQRHPDPDLPKEEANADGSTRQWSKAGRQYSNTAGLRRIIGEAIAELAWQSADEPMAAGPGATIQAAVEQLEIPNVSRIAHSARLAPYSFVAVEGNYTNGRVILYVVDDGTHAAPVCADFYERKEDEQAAA